MCDALHYAFEYLDRGWPVIPLQGKVPAVAWTSFQTARPSTEQVREWFAEGNYNLGVITGRFSELVVVDCDSPEDAAWWQRRFPPTPLAVRTGGGGVHFYYRYPNVTVRNHRGVLARRIDMRGDAGVIVAPPSIHPTTRQSYRWEAWSHYSLAAVPVFDAEWIEPTDQAPGTARTQHSDCRPPIKAGRNYIQRIVAVSGSGGHNATFRAACKLRDAGLTPEQALAVLADWNETNAVPPWNDKELIHKVTDAFRVRQ